ncbi:EGF-containing fibulin-like extracellular matrix protein 2 [Octopus bimaculoides]|uniref:EGF-like domain-containing protein n=1 Tax=Octopus bimaculoides TaxID=37653 RepID=A0A0L8H9E6_OCTBM|nr:EGF-containing fibulin-like extracellular matrix protein 2 [Octopus bimaculoides]
MFPLTLILSLRRIRYRMVQSSCRKCCRGFRYDRRTRRCVDINECLRPRRVCSHICINTPGSYFCMCRHGFQLVGGRYCRDFNECNCAHIYCPPPYHCFNTYGSYMCHCPHGFKPKGNWCYWMSRGKSRNAVPGKPSVIPKFEQVKKQQLKPITKSKPKK